MKCKSFLLLVIVAVLLLAIIDVSISAEGYSENDVVSFKDNYHLHRNLRKKGRRHHKDIESIVGDTSSSTKTVVDREDVVALPIAGEIDDPQQIDADPTADTAADGRKKKHMRQQHSQPHNKDMMKYTRLKSKIMKNADKFTAEEMNSINQDMDKYLELITSLPDFQGSIKKEHELNRGIKDKEARKVKFDEIKVKYQLEREKYKGTIDAGKNLFKIIRKKIDKKISTEEE